MEVDEIQRQVSKFQRVSSNGSSTTTTDNNLLLNNQKIATSRGNLERDNHVDDSGGGGGGGVGGIARLCGWPSSRIVRVSRASGGKDRHSKVLTSKGLRDRRVRLSVSTAIQFYDLQDRLGFDQPSKAVEWLLKAAASSIDELPSLDPSFSGVVSEQHHNNHIQVFEEKKLNENCNEFEDLNFQQQQQQQQQVEQQQQQQQNDRNNKKDVISNSKSKSPDYSSTSDTSKGSGLSLSRSENRMKARERAREMASKREKNVVLNHNLQTNISENSSFTDLLTGGINSHTIRRSPETRNHWSTTPPQPQPQPTDYFFTRPPHFNITAIDNHHHHHHNHFAFHQDSFIPTAVPTTTTSGGHGNGESYNLNFSMTSSSSAGGGVALAPGFSRGTLQSNLPYLQRFQSSSSIDGSTSTNLPVFIVPNNVSDHFPTTTGGYHLSYGGGGGGGGGDHHHKDKPKN